MTKTQRERDERGFTLIELLVVVLIIGILAAIAIPVFLGQQNQAKDAAAKSDIGSAKVALISYQTATGSFSGVTSTLLGTYGYSATGGNGVMSIKGAAGSGTFCILVPSATGNKFYITESGGVQGGVSTSACPGSYTTTIL